MRVVIGAVLGALAGYVLGEAYGHGRGFRAGQADVVAAMRLTRRARPVRREEVN